MLALIKLAFEMDLMRFVAFTLAAASSGQTWPCLAVHTAHHPLQHTRNGTSLAAMDTTTPAENEHLHR